MTGEQARRSICDDIGARLDCSSALKALCCLWLVPGIALTWIGFVSMGIRSRGSAATAQSLEQVQAAVLLLAIFTALVASMWIIRVGDALPQYRRALAHRTMEARMIHAGFVVVALVALVSARWLDSNLLFAVAAWSGFAVVVGSLRSVAAAPVARPYTLSAFVAACGFQLTVGWLHLLDPAGNFAMTTVAQGLILAWTATAAIREIAATQRTVRLGRTVGTVSREQVLRPLAEPAVGH